MAFDSRALPGMPWGTSETLHGPAPGPQPCQGAACGPISSLAPQGAVGPSRSPFLPTGLHTATGCGTPAMFGLVNNFEAAPSPVLVVIIVILLILILMVYAIRHRNFSRNEREAREEVEQVEKPRLEVLPAMEEGVWVSNPDGSIDVAHIPMSSPRKQLPAPSLGHKSPS
eukprot:jgi/Botrbrau1/23280/Bobra.0102s0023.1